MADLLLTTIILPDGMPASLPGEPALYERLAEIAADLEHTKGVAKRLDDAGDYNGLIAIDMVRAALRNERTWIYKRIGKTAEQIHGG